MFRIMGFVALILLVSACTKIDFKSEELQPVQSNFSDGDLNIIVLTEGTLISREANENLHSREYAFPPRILIHVSANIKHKDSPFTITSVSLRDESQANLLLLKPENLVLRDSWYKDIDKYETYGHLKNMGGLNTVRDILITPWISDIEINKDYVFSFSYINLEGIEKLIKIDYKAKLNTEKGFVPSKTYWNSI
ncbi:hypothetical protein [Teredinibacter purpureus]|uniref:hypothetical protein n=1 Tax=Teredinibacter purpureus TaxID=2731756 RepID=UPI0013C4F99D|nr:hypothetical protein [Teredinibacter purpureus]